MVYDVTSENSTAHLSYMVLCVLFDNADLWQILAKEIRRPVPHPN